MFRLLLYIPMHNLVCILYCSTYMLFQINSDCNENIGRVDNELKLLATTKKFPEDDVVSNKFCMVKTLYHFTRQCGH